MKKVSVLLLCLCLTAALSAGLTVRTATCDYRVNPLLVASEQPRFGWTLVSTEPGAHQTAYRIRVSSSEDFQGDCWETGKVSSDQSQLVTYEGNRLFPGKTYFWTVQV